MLVVRLVGRQDHDADAGLRGEDPRGRLVAVDAGHAQVHQHEVGRELAASATASSPSAASPTTSMSPADCEQRDDAAAHDRVVVGDQHADHADAPRGAGSRSSEVVAAGRARRRRASPPTRASRSRMPLRPKPSCRGAGSKPVPSSVTRQVARCRRAASSRIGAVARCACLRTLASPSCAQRSSTTSRSRSRSAAGRLRRRSTVTPVSRSKRSPSRRGRAAMPPRRAPAARWRRRARGSRRGPSRALSSSSARRLGGVARRSPSSASCARAGRASRCP